MIGYFLLALFWTVAILYIIGLCIGIFTYKHNNTTIVFTEEPEEGSEEQAEPPRYKEMKRVNMESMF